MILSSISLLLTNFSYKPGMAVTRVQVKTGRTWKLKLLKVIVTGLMMKKEGGEKEEVTTLLLGGRKKEGTSRGPWRSHRRRSITRVTEIELLRRSTRVEIVIVTGREKEVDLPRVLRSLTRSRGTSCSASCPSFYTCFVNYPRNYLNS